MFGVSQLASAYQGVTSANTAVSASTCSSPRWMIDSSSINATEKGWFWH
jgi:hypothetical protein